MPYKRGHYSAIKLSNMYLKCPFIFPGPQNKTLHIMLSGADEEAVIVLIIRQSTQDFNYDI